MTIQVNKDIEKYKNEVYKGLNPRQFVFAGIALIIGVLVVLAFYFLCYVPIDIAVYIGMPITIIIGIFGFLQIDDMTIYEYLKEKWRLMFFTPLSYKSDEYTKVLEAIDRYEKLKLHESKKNKKRKYKKEGV